MQILTLSRVDDIFQQLTIYSFLSAMLCNHELNATKKREDAKAFA
jgi:hypothetical protein